jgi:F-type H+-transporting ATPase subunit gamma
MQTAQDVQNRLNSARDLHSVVKTMKAMAAVSIRQYERTARSMDRYLRTVRLGLKAVLRDGRRVRLRHVEIGKGPSGLIVFGSDQGMCGSLNEQVSALVAENAKPSRSKAVVVGERAAGQLADRGFAVERVFGVPASTAGISPLMLDLLDHIRGWTEQADVSEVRLFFTRQKSGTTTKPEEQRLLPLDRLWLKALDQDPWPGKSLPLLSTDPQKLFTELVREYLFAALFRATAQSLAGENAMRLASMQGAEKNIEDKLEELQRSYQQMRQAAITSELLDIASGFEALRPQEA